jgi:hypothetical protein
VAEATDTVGGGLRTAELTRCRASGTASARRAPASSSRLKEHERGEVIRRRLSSAPAGPVVNELTEYGQELEDIAVRLGLWGAKTMSGPRSGDTLSADALCLCLRALFQGAPGASVGARYVVRVDDAVVTVTVDGDTIDVADGPAPDADLELVAGAADLQALLSGRLAPEEAVRDNRVGISGDAGLLDRFVETFSIATLPAPERLVGAAEAPSGDSFGVREDCAASGCCFATVRRAPCVLALAHAFELLCSRRSPLCSRSRSPRAPRRPARTPAHRPR